MISIRKKKIDYILTNIVDYYHQYDVYLFDIDFEYLKMNDKHEEV
jgi:hypothetical protein